MNIQEYEAQLIHNIFEDREGNTRIKLNFLCKILQQNQISYSNQLISKGSEIREYLLDECNIPPHYLDDWVNTNSVHDIFIGDLLEYEGFKNGNVVARNLNRFYRSAGYRTHFQNLLGIKLLPGIDGVQRLLNGVAETPFEWELEFTDEFYAAVFLHYDYEQKNQCGLFIKTYIYNWFPELVNRKLDFVNPLIDERWRAKKYHQFFRGEALRELRNHIRMVIILLTSSRDKIDFKEKMIKVPRIERNMSLPQRTQKHLPGSRTV